MNTKLLTRIFSKVERAGDCWLWTGCRLPKGYGRIRFGGRHWMAHRVTYELFVGSVPDGLEIDHLCRMPSCINPAHMETVTQAENRRRQFIARGNYCKRGHEFTLYRQHSGARVCRVCRRDYMREYMRKRAALALAATCDQADVSTSVTLRRRRTA